MQFGFYSIFGMGEQFVYQAERRSATFSSSLHIEKKIVSLNQNTFIHILRMKRLFIFSKVPFKSYMLLAFLTIGTMGLSNTSLGYLNYPTQVIFKSSKLIPVMIGGILIQGILLYICSWLIKIMCLFEMWAH